MKHEAIDVLSKTRVSSPNKFYHPRGAAVDVDGLEEGAALLCQDREAHPPSPSEGSQLLYRVPSGQGFLHEC